MRFVECWVRQFCPFSWQLFLIYRFFFGWKENENEFLTNCCRILWYTKMGLFDSIGANDVARRILISDCQKQPSRGVLRKSCSENMQWIYRRTPMRKCDFIKVAKQLYWHHTAVWVFSCKFAWYFQSTFSWEHIWRAASGLFFLKTFPRKNLHCVTPLLNFEKVIIHRNICN